MKKPESLDELVSKKAAEFADQIKAAASMADKEEEIRIEVERQLAFIEREVGIKLEGKHEFTVASGRVDSVYDRVIIEYKNPSSPGARIGPRADSPGSKKVVEQIKSRFYDMRSQHGQQLNTLFGVGLDGNYFIFIRFRNEKWDVQEPVEVNKYSAERFLWALFNLGSKGNRPFSPEYLAGDFGSASESSVATGGIRALYNAIVTTDHPKAQTFFSQWKILFGEVCGYDVDNPSDKIKKLAEFYGVPVKGIKPAEMLFAVHSYYGIFMKLLASEIIAFFHRLPTPLNAMIQAGTSKRLKREIEDLEAGSIFRHLNITNFLEGDLFAWYTSVWSDPIEKLIRDMVARLDNYNPGTLSEDPATSRDLLKKLYQQLFPESVRHDLGEYYTPDWLAEHVLNEVGYVGDPDKRLLDPACGSGTFLVMAISRIRSWYEENRERCRYDEGDLCRKILSNVIGFDLNPLAVMAARTNYLISIRDLIGLDKIEIPVYLCDSIVTPSEYGGLFSAGLGKAKSLKTAPTTFIIPTEITSTRQDVAKYAEQLEFCILNGYSPPEFIQRCRDEGLTISEDMLHSALYEELVRLDKANKNGVWARIIKNAFAPLFSGEVDYVVGNPPWINWESLPSEYREGSLEIWTHYGLIPEKGQLEKMRGGKKDLSMLFVYCAADQYLKMNGMLGYVIIQSLFKSGAAAAGFRRFELPKKAYLQVLKVDDMSDLSPFQGATNRTAVFICTKGDTPTAYPVSYDIWTSNVTEAIEQFGTYSDVMSAVDIRSLAAQPSSVSNWDSAWLTAERAVLGGINKTMGHSEYVAREGVNSGGLSGCYWVRILASPAGNRVLIENLNDAGKKKLDKVQMSVESDLVYPLLRGRDVQRWCSQPKAFIIAPQDPQKRREGIPENRMRRDFPRTYAYLKHFEEELTKRADRKYYPDASPFYTMRNVADYTRSSWKVVFKDLSEFLQCAVVGSSDVAGTLKPVFADLTLRLIPAGTEAEAHYLAAVLNSSPCLVTLHASSVGVQTQRYHPSDIAKLALASFDARNPLHARLSLLSQECHASALTGSRSHLGDLEQEVDRAAAEYWGINEEELHSITKALREMEGN